MILLPFLLFFLLFISPVFAETTQYNIAATYQDETHRIVGTEEIIFINTGLKPVSELSLLLYPNLYLNHRSDLDRTYFRKVYPVAFNPGGQEITGIEDVRGNELPFSIDPLYGDILVIVHLPIPIPPRGTFRFFVRFVTTIPEKFGVFGHYKDLVTLQGGWHPYLAHFSKGKWHLDQPPPKSRYRINLSLKNEFQLLGSVQMTSDAAQTKERTLSMEGEGIPFFSLSIGRGLIQTNTQIGAFRISYNTLKRSRSYIKRVQDTIETALTFFLKQSGPIPPTEIAMVDAYLHQDLTAIGSNVLYINTRLFKVFPALKRFHEASLVKGFYQLLWRKIRPDEEWWVIESLAGQDADAYIAQRYGKKFSLSSWLKPIGFIPVIDQILYSKNLPLRQVYFREATAPLVSEDIRFYNNPPSESPNIFYKLETLMGETIFEAAVTRYRNQDPQKGERESFRKMLQASSGQEMDRLIDLWLTRRAEIDFKIEEVRHRKMDGVYQTSILINKHGEGIEPLQIVAFEKDGSKIPLVWDGVGNEHSVKLETTSRIKTVEIDPNKLLNDPNRKNNRVPRDRKVLLDEFQLNYDFQTDDLNYRASLLFQYLYDTKNWVRLIFSQTTTGDLSHIGYTTTLKKNHLLTTGLTFERLDPSQNNAFKEEAAFLSLGYAFIFPDLPLLAESIQRLSNTLPSFNVGLTYNQQFTGDEFDNSFLLRLDFRRVFSFSNYHEISTRFLIGQSVGDLFENRRFFLGGTNGMRGYRPLTFEGENISLFSLEYRFPLFYETDINLFGLAHTHTWQGAIFTDTGMVASSHNVFRVDRFQSDVGAGIRFFVDLFGVYPSIIRFDVAIPIDSPIESEDEPHYYLNIGQSF